MLLNSIPERGTKMDTYCHQIRIHPMPFWLSQERGLWQTVGAPNSYCSLNCCLAKNLGWVHPANRRTLKCAFLGDRDGTTICDIPSLHYLRRNGRSRSPTVLFHVWPALFCSCTEPELSPVSGKFTVSPTACVNRRRNTFPGSWPGPKWFVS